MECPTALKILKELWKSEKAGTVFNSFGNPDKKREVRIALKELNQAINSYEKFKKTLETLRDEYDDNNHNRHHKEFHRMCKICVIDKALKAEKENEKYDTKNTIIS